MLLYPVASGVVLEPLIGTASDGGQFDDTIGSAGYCVDHAYAFDGPILLKWPRKFASVLYSGRMRYRHGVGTLPGW